MKTDWVEGDIFYFCKHKPSKERGTLVDKVPFGNLNSIVWHFSDNIL